MIFEEVQHLLICGLFVDQEFLDSLSIRDISQMQEQSIFVSDDGTRFETAEDALLWDEISARVKILEEAPNEMWDRWVPPEGLKNQKEWVHSFLGNGRNDYFLGDRLDDPSERLENFRGLNYLTNYIFYGSANPCQP